MDQITHNVRSAQWLEIVTQCQNRSEGTTVKQWLSDNGIKEKAYYYWLRKFRKQAYAQMHLPSTEVSNESDISFAEVSIPDRRTTGISEVTEAITVEAIRPVAVIKNADMTIALTNEVLWSSFFVTLLAKKYHYSIMQLGLLILVIWSILSGLSCLIG